MSNVISYAGRYMLKRLTKNLFCNQKGSVIIEYSILLPLATVFLLGVMEFGFYFVRDEVASNAVSSVTQTIQNNPGYYASLNSTQLAALEKTYGSGVIDFTKPGNYLCVQAYADPVSASSAPACTATNLVANSPNGTGTTYYISVQADLPQGGITPLVNYVSRVKNIQVARASGAIQINTVTPPSCSAAGHFLQYNPAQNPPWICSTVSNNNGSDCSQPWEKLILNSSGNYVCTAVPYVFAGGISNPTTSSTNGAAISPAVWSGHGTIMQDITYNTWGGPTGSDAGASTDTEPFMSVWVTTTAATYGTTTNGDITTWPSGTSTSTFNGNQASAIPWSTLCEPVTFTVPAINCPGKIVAQGNLLTPGTWKSWVVSFVDLNLPSLPTTSSYSASGWVCESSGANYQPYNDSNGHAPTVAAEHDSWTIMYVPPSTSTQCN